MFNSAAAKSNDKYIGRDFQLNPILRGIAERFPTMPIDEPLSLEELLESGEVTCMPSPPYRDAYGPYQEHRFDWFKLVLWKMDLGESFQWMFQFTFVGDPPTKCFDRTDEQIRMRMFDDLNGEWYECHSTHGLIADPGAKLHLIHPERRGIPGLTKNTWIAFPPESHFQQLI